MSSLKIVAEFSGGVDSTLAVCLIKKRYPKAKIYPLFIDYEQPCNWDELVTSDSLIKKLNLEKMKFINLPNIWNTPITKQKINKKLSNVYTPLRNMVILSIAASYAEELGAKYIISGTRSFCKTDDLYSFKDSTLPFYKMMEGVINYTTEGKNKIEILLPLVEGRTSKITKKEEFVMLKKFGINHNEVWNCFTPIDDGKICRKCNNCKERLKILRELGWK